MTTKRRVCDSFCPNQCARARDPAPKCDFGCRDETRTTHDDAKTRRAARTLERDVTFGLHLINPLDSCARHRTACGVYPLNPALDENAHEGTNEGTNMTPAEGGNRPSSSSSSLPRDANGTKIERKKGTAILSTRIPSMSARDATMTTTRSLARKSKCEQSGHPSPGCRVGKEIEWSVGYIGGS